jgi:hypothetical protein
VTLSELGNSHSQESKDNITTSHNISEAIEFNLPAKYRKQISHRGKQRIKQFDFNALNVSFF